MKHLFIINPKAGKSNRAAELKTLIDRVMADKAEEYKIELTEYPMHAASLVSKNASGGEPLRVYACGGDGTLNEAVNGAAGLENVAVTHFPCGTGNDFIKIFGKSAGRFHDIKELIDGEVIPLDLIACGDRKCLNICSAGFDARIAAGVALFKRIPFLSGKGAYNLSVLLNLFTGIHYPFEVSVDAVKYDGRYTMLVACNGRYYGGGFNPVPEALPDDGLLDFLLIGPVTRLTVARVIKKYEKGLYGELPEYITHIRGKRMDIESARKFAVNIDGEIVETETISFYLLEKALNFIVPRGASWV